MKRHHRRVRSCAGGCQNSLLSKTGVESYYLLTGNGVCRPADARELPEVDSGLITPTSGIIAGGVILCSMQCGFSSAAAWALWPGGAFRVLSPGIGAKPSLSARWL